MLATEKSLEGKTMSAEEIVSKLTPLLDGYDISRACIFGSYARGEQRPDSDLDLLVEFRAPKSLLTLVRIERELSDSLGIKIDLLTEQAISPYLIERIKSEMKVVYQ